MTVTSQLSLAHLVMLWPDAFLVAVTAAAAEVAAWCEGKGCVASVGRVGRCCSARFRSVSTGSTRYCFVLPLAYLLG